MSASSARSTIHSVARAANKCAVFVGYDPDEQEGRCPMAAGNTATVPRPTNVHDSRDFLIACPCMPSSRMASRELRVFWTTPTHRCVLWRIDGVLEVRLHAGHR